MDLFFWNLHWCQMWLETPLIIFMRKMLIVLGKLFISTFRKGIKNMFIQQRSKRLCKKAITHAVIINLFEWFFRIFWQCLENTRRMIEWCRKCRNARRKRRFQFCKGWLLTLRLYCVHWCSAYPFTLIAGSLWWIVHMKKPVFKIFMLFFIKL